MQLDATDSERLAIADGTEIPLGVSHSPQHVVGRMQKHRRVERIRQLRGDRDVVIVPMGANDCHHVAAADGHDDRPGVVGGVEDDDVVVVADEPDVVVDFPGSAVEFEGAVGDHAGDVVAHRITTERSTASASEPACILWNASSIPSRPMRSETNFSSGSLPCR